jgi:tetratricopeptide (TPR) repeat protein
MNRLYKLLRDHSNLSLEALNQHQSALLDPDDGRELGGRLINANLITLSAIMEIALKYDLFPQADAILKRLATIRQNQQTIKPTRHTTRYLLSEDDVPVDQVELIEIGVSIPIPVPNMKSFRDSSTDEKQVADMAFELARMNQIQEAEMFMIDALEEFPNSMRITIMLSWHYCRCQHFKEAMQHCHNGLKNNASVFPLVEYLGIAEQALGKHLLAINHFQKLVSLARVKPIWHLQLAVSLERARLSIDARQNYQAFLSINADPELEQFAQQRSTILAG